MKSIKELNEQLPLSNWIETIHNCMKEKGFHEGVGLQNVRMNTLARLALIHTEITEFSEEIGKDEVVHELCYSEIADIFIRLFDMLGFMDYTAFQDENGLNEWFSQRSLFSFDDIVTFKFIDEIEAIETLHSMCSDISQHVKRLFVDGDFGSTSLVSFDKKSGLHLADILSDFISELVFVSKILGLTTFLLSEQIKAKMLENMNRPHKYGTPSASTINN